MGYECDQVSTLCPPDCHMRALDSKTPGSNPQIVLFVGSILCFSPLFGSSWPSSCTVLAARLGCKVLYYEYNGLPQLNMPRFAFSTQNKHSKSPKSTILTDAALSTETESEIRSYGHFERLFV